MKAMKPRPLALLYAPVEENAALYTAALEDLMRVRRLTAQDMDQALSALAAGKVGTDGGEAPAEAFLVLSGCDSAFVNKVLRALRAPGVPSLPLKATLTPHNANWTARQLYEEICRERAEIEKAKGGN